MTVFTYNCSGTRGYAGTTGGDIRPICALRISGNGNYGRGEGAARLRKALSRSPQPQPPEWWLRTYILLPGGHVCSNVPANLLSPQKEAPP